MSVPGSSHCSIPADCNLNGAISLHKCFKSQSDPRDFPKASHPNPCQGHTAGSRQHPAPVLPLFFLSVQAALLTFRLSGSSVRPAYPGFIVMKTAQDGTSGISVPSNMKVSTWKIKNMIILEEQSLTCKLNNVAEFSRRRTMGFSC